LPTLEIIIFGALALIAIASAVMMIVTRNAVHSALFLVVVMACLAVFCLGLSGPFIAVVQVAVYAGAIMVLFLFVIMLLGAERVGARLERGYQVPLAIIFALAVVILGGYVLLQMQNQPIQVVDLPTNQIATGTPEAIGQTLFSSYLFPFEAVSILLLTAMVGAVVLTRDEKKRSP
jgi:NADH-quinone oxidoreductase subunit J